MLIYCAVPIDQSGDSGLATRLWNAAIGVQGVVTYHPASAFAVGPGVAPGVGLERANRAALAACDGLVAVVPVGVPSIGVPREIEYAKSLGIPVAVCTNVEWSFSLADVARFELSDIGYAKAIEYVRDQAATREPTQANDELLFYVGPDGTLPARAYAGDAGYDLHVSERVVIPSGQFRDVPMDLRVALPHGVWARIVGRSSTLRSRGLLVVEGVIDSGYRGPLYSGVHNLSESTVALEPGERVAQLIPHPNLATRMVVRGVAESEFEAIPPVDARGSNGFGSSGK